MNRFFYLFTLLLLGIIIFEASYLVSLEQNASGSLSMQNIPADHRLILNTLNSFPNEGKKLLIRLLRLGYERKAFNSALFVSKFEGRVSQVAKHNGIYSVELTDINNKPYPIKATYTPTTLAKISIYKSNDQKHKTTIESIKVNNVLLVEEVYNLLNAEFVSSKIIIKSN